MGDGDPNYQHYELYQKLNILLNEYLKNLKYEAKDQGPEWFIEQLEDCKKIVEMHATDLDGLIWLKYHDYIRSLKEKIEKKDE